MPKRPPVFRRHDPNPVHQPHGKNEVPRIRGRRWMAIRAAYFRQHPLCEACKREGITKEATFLDHVVPLYAGGKEDWSNYQGLCKSHAFSKNGREQSARLRNQPAPVEPEPARDPERKFTIA